MILAFFLFEASPQRECDGHRPRRLITWGCMLHAVVWLGVWPHYLRQLSLILRKRIVEQSTAICVQQRTYTKSKLLQFDSTAVYPLTSFAPAHTHTHAPARARMHSLSLTHTRKHTHRNTHTNHAPYHTHWLRIGPRSNPGCTQGRSRIGPGQAQDRTHTQTHTRTHTHTSTAHTHAHTQTRLSAATAFCVT